MKDIKELFQTMEPKTDIGICNNDDLFEKQTNNQTN